MPYESCLTSLASRIRDRDEALEPPQGFTGIDRPGCKCDALCNIWSASRDHKGRRRVEKGDVPIGAGIAPEHAVQRLRICRSVAAAQGLRLGTCQAGVFRCDLEGFHRAVLKCGDKSRA